MLSIQKILTLQQACPILTVGRVKAIRYQKQRVFAHLHDGSCRESLQLVIEPDKLPKDVSIGSAIEAQGHLVPSPAKGQAFELACDAVRLHSTQLSKENPVHAKDLPLPYLRNFPHLRSRAEPISSTLRLRAALFSYIRHFFEKNDFIEVTTPILTQNNCEGGGDAFELKDEEYFTHPVSLTVSSQLHLECFAQSHHRVYTLSPCFRAEQSQSRRHLSEFYMCEAEQTFLFGLSDLVDLCKRLLHSLASSLAASSHLDEAGKARAKSLSQLHLLTYKEAIGFLGLKFGSDIHSDGEQLLAKQYGPVIITHYPAALKPFYMAREGDLALNLDIILPEAGEIIGGSLREASAAVLEQRITDPRDLQWYLDLRRLGGIQSGGFGLGVDRLLSYLTGISNVRDVSPIGRWHTSCRL